MSMCIYSPQNQPVIAEVARTIESNILARDRRCHVKLMPTHCINTDGEAEGFSLSIPGHARGDTLPLNRTMFHGTSLFEIRSSSTTMTFNEHVVRLITESQQAHGTLRDRVAKAMEELDIQSRTGRIASLACIPEDNDRTSTDSASWVPEPPRTVGLYHTFCRGFQRDVRSHRLFIGVNGGLTRACDEFFNLHQHVGCHWTCNEVAVSEEAWWLRKACQRARCRIARYLADRLDLDVTSARDMFSFVDRDKQAQLIASPIIDTVEFDMSQVGDNVEYYSGCVDTTSVSNGILVNMHPSEGVWIFKGSSRSSSKPSLFGSIFGTKAACGVLPCRAPCYRRGMGSASCVLDAMGGDHIAVSNSGSSSSSSSSSSNSSNNKSSLTTPVYQCFDEPLLQYFSEHMQWDRNYGIVELVPMAVWHQSCY